MSDASLTTPAAPEPTALRIMGLGPKQWLPALMLAGALLLSALLAYFLPADFPESRLNWFGERVDLFLVLGISAVGGGGLVSDAIKAIRDRRAGP